MTRIPSLFASEIKSPLFDFRTVIEQHAGLRPRSSAAPPLNSNSTEVESKSEEKTISELEEEEEEGRDEMSISKYILNYRMPVY